ncbi:MAG: hypothetical protein ACLP8B_19025, partial [Xanthobacteraceae bacterium]
MPAFTFEKLPPPARRESATASSSRSPSPAPSAADPPPGSDPLSTPDHFSRIDYLSATRIRSHRGFVVQMINRLTRSRSRQ